jgi:predicted Zn-dependent peptidase
MDFIGNLRDNLQLAQDLAKYQAYTGDWRNFDKREKLKAVTPEDIMRVANKYLTKSNRTVITLIPTKKEKK